MASIEGRRGMPRPRPPYPAQSGLWGKPTVLNNVGTFLNVPLIVSNPRLFPEGQTTEALAGLVDIVPTLAALAGVPDPARYRFPGRDLTPILADLAASVQDYVHFTSEDDTWPAKGAGCIRAIVEKD